MIRQVIHIIVLSTVVYGHFQQQHSHIGLSTETKTLVNSRNANAIQVLIIGAGISGLEAARLLQEKGIKTLVIEARNRSGGRIWSLPSRSGHMLDIGATWIHGIHGSIPNGLLSNPLWDLTREAKIPTRGTQLDDLLSIYPTNDNASDVHHWFSQYIAFVREGVKLASTNVSLGYYANQFVNQMNFTSKQRYAFYSYVNHAIENNEGAELNDIGAKGFLDVTSIFYGDEHIFHETGFMAITDYLAKDMTDIRFNQVVSKIAYSNQSVEVTTTDRQIYRADFVLLTVPLGVLKKQQIQFIPPLPSWKRDAIDRIGYNAFEKVFLLWDRAWWNATNFYFMRVSSNATRLGYWVNANKWNDKPALICFFLGKEATQMTSQRNQTVLVEELQRTLEEMFPGTVVPPPVEVHVTNWNEDPFSYGSYSYVSTQQKHTDPVYLAEPVEHRLLFAGEATNIDTYGYAHGALLSARREVTRLLFVYNLSPTPNGVSALIASTKPLTIFSLLLLFLCKY